MYYVSCIDTFLSGWGLSKGKENKLIFECETKKEMDKLVYILNSRSDMEHVCKDIKTFPKALLENPVLNTDDTYYQLKKAKEWLNYKP